MELIRGEKLQEVNNKQAFSSNLLNRRSSDEIEKDLELIKKCLKAIMGPDLSFNQKMDKILEVNTLVIPELFREFTSSMPSVDKSMVGVRILSAIKDLSSIILKKREAEMAEEINPNSPKFQLIFSWFIEVLNAVLERQGLDIIQINNIFNDLSSELNGWEDKIIKRLRGVSAKALDQVKNPLVEKIDKEQIMGGFEL